MIWPLDIDTFGPVLKLLGQKDAPDSGTIITILLFVVSVPLLLALAYTVRRRKNKREARERSTDQLAKIGHQKNLDHTEQSALMRIAGASHLQNPAALVTSIDVFDHAVAERISHLRQGPWLEMEAELERLTALREKIGFRHIPADRAPSTTRQLQLGHKIFVLAPHEESFRLLSTEVLNLDDLAICTGPFLRRTHPVELKSRQELWAFFFAADGKEYRFRTQVYKVAHYPSPHLLLAHAERLFQDKDGDLFGTPVEQTCEAIRLPAAKARSSHPGPELFKERVDDAESLTLELTGVRGSGFSAVSDKELSEKDLILLRGKEGILKAVNGSVGRIINVSGHTFRCSYAGMDDNRRTAVLDAIAGRLNREATQAKLR